MNGAANAATSGGIAAAAVTISNWILTLAHCAAMPTDVQTAFSVLLTGLAGYIIHIQTKGI